ncbi:hypothetical protein GOP47_0013416 [Adiantum capillus-veneris]|uniref:Uncharacterized protein n=1 Tax=Adiantum capillus-veneris TaxID=13818 RepID=A0A9D4UNQ0_ADICA|nr:hypothetical protein GOP47_0013416 [Adiantum capillus-veneris]
MDSDDSPGSEFQQILFPPFTASYIDRPSPRIVTVDYLSIGNQASEALAWNSVVFIGGLLLGMQGGGGRQPKDYLQAAYVDRPSPRIVTVSRLGIPLTLAELIVICMEEIGDEYCYVELSFIHETGFWNTTDPNHQSAMLSNIERDIDKLEHVLIGSEEGIYGSDSYTDAMWETHRKFDTLQEEIHRLQTLLDSKESSLKFSLHEATVLRNHLQVAEAQASSLRLFKESHDSKHIEELSSLERLPSQSLEIIYNHLTVNEAMNKSMEKVGKAWESIARLYTSSVASKLIEILQREASLYFQSIIIFTEELAKAEAQVSSLHQKLINTEGSLEKERKSLRAARDGLDELDCALGNEESKVDDLFKEVSSLKAQLEQKETTVQSLKNEALKNKGLQETARKHLTAFHQSEEKVEQLTAQCNALVNQIKSKNSLLEDIRKEAFDKTEALRLATQIKQELNLCRHREVQLAQELERERLQKNELSHELMENSRAVKAEQALRQAEKDIMDLNRELAFLRNGIKSKDDAIRMMQQKIDGNIQILQSASNDREAMRKMKAYIHSLESKLSEFI